MKRLLTILAMLLAKMSWAQGPPPPVGTPIDNDIWILWISLFVFFLFIGYYRLRKRYVRR